jgi:hypothetical protein
MVEGALLFLLKLKSPKAKVAVVEIKLKPPRLGKKNNGATCTSSLRKIIWPSLYFLCSNYKGLSNIRRYRNSRGILLPLFHAATNIESSGHVIHTNALLCSEESPLSRPGEPPAWDSV